MLSSSLQTMLSTLAPASGMMASRLCLLLEPQKSSSNCDKAMAFVQKHIEQSLVEQDHSISHMVHVIEDTPIVDDQDATSRWVDSLHLALEGDEVAHGQCFAERSGILQTTLVQLIGNAGSFMSTSTKSVTQLMKEAPPTFAQLAVLWGPELRVFLLVVSSESHQPNQATTSSGGTLL